MPITTFVVRDEYFDNPIHTHIGVTRSVVYTAQKDDGEGVYFNDDTAKSRYLYHGTIRAVKQGVQIPDATPWVSTPEAWQADAVNHPSHYNQGGIECIDALRACMSHEAFCGFLKGNQIKYLWRYESKGKAAEDLGKSNWYGALLEKTVKENESK